MTRVLLLSVALAAAISQAQAGEAYITQAGGAAEGILLARAQALTSQLLVTPVSLDKFAPAASNLPTLPAGAPGSNTSQIMQVGRDNTALVMQMGGGNASVILQQGRGNTATVFQSGRGR